MTRFIGLYTKVQWRLRALRQLQSIADVWLFCRICVVALIAPRLTNQQLLADFRRRAYVREQMAAPANAQVNRTHVDRIVVLTDLALQVGHRLIQNHSAVRSLTLYYILSISGFTVDLYSGIVDGELGYVTHLWLVRNGHPFAEHADTHERFDAIYRITGAQHQRCSEY